MPFEPRLIRPDDVCDDETELALPADLAALAEQLTADANYIAARYVSPSQPARSQAQSVEHDSRWHRALTAAAILLIASAGVARWMTWPQTQHAAAPTMLVNGHHHVAGETQPAADSAVPAQFFQGLSGPEREGLLDLLEKEAKQQASLSI
jgi:hypothetical protein